MVTAAAIVVAYGMKGRMEGEAGRWRTTTGEIGGASESRGPVMRGCLFPHRPASSVLPRRFAALTYPSMPSPIDRTHTPSI